MYVHVPLLVCESMLTSQAVRHNTEKHHLTHTGVYDVPGMRGIVSVQIKMSVTTQAEISRVSMNMSVCQSRRRPVTVIHVLHYVSICCVGARSAS